MSSRRRPKQETAAQTARALELIGKGIPNAAICARLGITRQRLCQIRHDAKNPQRKVVPQWDGAAE